MASRSEELARRLEDAVATFLNTVEGLPEADWHTMCPNEQRTVGVLARHVAAAIPFEMRVFREIAAGRQPATITTAWLAEVNAADADAWAASDRDETLRLLRANAADAAREVRRLGDAQLALTGRYVDEMGDRTLDAWLDGMLVGHVLEHLESIRAALPADTMRRATGTG
jgi:hypothetical protein